METKDSDIKMNQYINGELTGEALQNFEQLLLSDPALAKEVALHKQIDQTLRAKKTNRKSKKLKELFDQFGEKYILNETAPSRLNEPLVTEKNSRGVIRWLAPIASVAAAALFIFYIGFGNAEPSQLAEQYYKVYIFDNISRSGNTDNLALAQQAYDSKDYQKAKNLFSQYPDNSSAQIAKGNCEFLLDEPGKAIETFKQLTNKNIDIHVKAQVRWYLALSYLKLDNISEAKNNFQSILAFSKYYEDSQDILKKLD